MSGPVPFIHDTARVDDGAEIGAGSRIWHFSHILTGSRLGANCVVGQNVITPVDQGPGARRAQQGEPGAR